MMPSTRPLQASVRLPTACALGFASPCTRNSVPRNASSAARSRPSNKPPRDDGSTDWIPAQRYMICSTCWRAVTRLLTPWETNPATNVASAPSPCITDLSDSTSPRPRISGRSSIVRLPVSVTAELLATFETSNQISAARPVVPSVYSNTDCSWIWFPSATKLTSVKFRSIERMLSELRVRSSPASVRPSLSASIQTRSCDQIASFELMTSSLFRS